MIIKYDESQEHLVRRLLESKDIVIGLDVAEWKDKCIEVSFSIRHKDEILIVEHFIIEE